MLICTQMRHLEDIHLSILVCFYKSVSLTMSLSEKLDIGNVVVYLEEINAVLFFFAFFTFSQIVNVG